MSAVSTEAEHISVAFLGPEGTYTHQAAHLGFADTANYVPRRTIADVYHSVDESIPFGILPQENTIYGIVTETYDLLRLEDLGRTKWIRGAITLPVQHCLLVRKGQKLDSIKKIMSHEQALGQCTRFISKHLPEATLVKVASTASAAAQISITAEGLSSDATQCGVIASKFCTTMFDGLEVLHEGIQNESGNFTRFYILANSPTAPAPLQTSSDDGQNDRRRQALIRITTGPLEPACAVEGSRNPDIFECLTAALWRTVTIVRVDRRSALQHVPFQDVYFVELCERPGVPDGSGGKGNEHWALEIQSGVDRICQIGAQAQMLGVW